MRLNLKQLIIITCIALAGIILLQIFWLANTYSEKKTQLLSTVNNTMVETQIFTGVNPALTRTIKTVAGNLIDSIRNTIDDSIVLITDAEENADEDISPEQKRFLSMLQSGKSNAAAYSLEEYGQQLKRAFAFKGISMSFDMALFDANGSIRACTTDSATFLNTPDKSMAAYSLPVKFKGGLSGQLQIAMPGLTLYLLKDMAWILICSVLLIIVCCCSFYGMVRMFFREKRLADIRNDFMNNMTHELKTPISAASLALELMRDTPDTMTDAKQEYAQLAAGELNRLSALVDKVLKMAAFERKEALLYKRLFDAGTWLQQVSDTIRPLTDRLPVTIRKTIEPHAIDLWGDPEHLSGLMLNLLENAVKYRDKSKPELIIDIAIRQTASHYIISVADNGIGIVPQYLDKIFDKFFRVPTGDRHDTKGYGLGLSYVSEIVRLHKGTIKAESEEKEGTSFEIYIPRDVS